MKLIKLFFNPLYRLFSINKKEVYPTVKIPYDEVEKYIHQVEVEFNVFTDDKDAINREFAQCVANYLIENELITYSVISKNEYNGFGINRIRCNFLMLSNRFKKRGL